MEASKGQRKLWNNRLHHSESRQKDYGETALESFLESSWIQTLVLAFAFSMFFHAFPPNNEQLNSIKAEINLMF